MTATLPVSTAATATLPATAVGSSSKPPVNLHDHHTTAFIFLLSGFNGLGREQQPDRCPRLDLVKAMKVSQTMRNVLAWCAASPTAANAVEEYYTFDHEIQRDKLPPLLAVIGVCIEAMGMPGWGKAVEAVESAQRHFDIIVAESRKADGGARQARLESTLHAVSADLAEALYNVQMRGRCEEHYAPLAEHDMHLLVRLRQATGVLLRWLISIKPELAAGVRQTLQALLQECARRATEARVSGEAAIARLAEQVAEKVMAGPMAAMAERFEAVEAAVAETKSVAYAAEQIAAAADETVAAMKKPRCAAKSHCAGGAVHAMADAVKGLDGRVGALERLAPPAVKREELRTLARQVDAVDDMLGSLSIAVQDSGRLAARLGAAESALERMTARLEQADATVDRLAARLEAAEATKERLTARVEWVTSLMHSHFAWRWNEVQAHLHAMQMAPASPPPASPREDSAFDA